MRKNRKPLYLGALGAVLLVVVGVFGVYFYTKNNSTKEIENFTTEYFTLINERKYEEMYDKLSSDSKEGITKEEFIKRNKNIYEGIEGRNISLENINVTTEGSDIKSSFDLKMDTLAGEVKESNVMTLKKEGDTLGVKWSSNLIFKDLNNNYKVKVETSKGKRGDIVDRNGAKLATDSVLASVGVELDALGENKEEALNAISKELNLPLDFVKGKINQSWVKPGMFVPIKTYSYKDPLVEKAKTLKGVVIQDKEGRVYPLGEKAGHLTGYVQNVTKEDLDKNEGKGYGENSVIGRTGLEAIYEDKIRGVDGARIYIVDDYSKEVLTVKNREVVHGETVKLTIDSNLQEIAYDSLGNEKGSTVSLNPDTGEVLTLVSSPSLNPNDFVVGLTNEKWDALNNDPKKPLYNRFQSNISPGSAFKPIVAAIGLETKKLNPTENKNITGSKWQKDASWGGYNVTRVKEYSSPSNLENALVYSDNIYFAKVALDIGGDDFVKELKKFGMTEKLPFEYGVAQSQISASGDLNNEILLADSGYGQGQVLINPLEIATMYTMFKNDGNIIAPYLVYGEGKGKKILKEGAISKETANIILDDLLKVVENPNGTAKALNNGTVKIGAKTGTAEVKASQDDTTGTEIGWVVAMTTNKNNNILVSSFIEDVKDKGGSGYVVQKAKSVIEAAK